jgi:hypothetical protein
MPRKRPASAGPCLVPNAGADIAPFIGSGVRVQDVQVPQKTACSFFGPNAPPNGRPTDPDPTGGYYQPVVAFVDDEPDLGTIRIDCGSGNAEPVEYRARYRANENPAIDSLAIRHAGTSTPIAPFFDGGPEGPVTDAASRVAADAGSESGTQPEASPRSGTATAASIITGGSHVSLRAAWAECPRTSKCGDGVCGEHEDTTGMPETGVGREEKCLEDCAFSGKPTPRGCTGAETYAWADPNAHDIKDRREGIVVSWYATAGTFENRRTGVAESDPDQSFSDNGWTAPKDRKDVRFWLVIRDDRGGVGWQTYEVSVR